jgi:hypothetical protein
MNDDTNGLTVDDTALFNATVTGTELPTIEAPITEEAPAPVLTPATEPPAAATDPQRTEPAIPPARLREEADARRAAERDRDELKERLARLEAQIRQPAQQQQQEQRKPAEFWDNPDEWGRSLVTPIQEQLFQQRQGVSRLLAEEKHGADTVKAAYQALGEAMQADPAVQTDYMRIMRSQHPYGELVAWHKNRQVLNDIGSDPAAYRNRVLEEAMKDPEVQQRFLAQIRGAAQPTVEPPSRSSVPAIPSLQGIGTAASPAAAAGEPSDAELFSATTRRRR